MFHVSSRVGNRLELSPNKRPQSRGKPLSRSTSKTRQKPSPRDKEIENLKNEIRILQSQTIRKQTNSLKQTASPETIQKTRRWPPHRDARTQTTQK